MTISEMLLADYDQEMKNTRTILERVPDDRFAWKPHEKSMALGRLASHIAELPKWAAVAIQTDGLNLNTDEKPFLAASRQQLLEAFERNAAEGRAAIAGASDDHFSKTWTLSFGESTTIFSMPRVAVVRNSALNHLIHHRAQLGVYLRLLNIAVPGMYGPSADEMTTFFAQA